MSTPSAMPSAGALPARRMTRHMTVTLAEPASTQPWDWTCPWCPGGYSSQAPTSTEAIGAATGHAIVEHGHALPQVDVYDVTGHRAMAYGYCYDPTCPEHGRRAPVEHVTPDTCGRCGGLGCGTCLDCHDRTCRSRFHAFGRR